MFENIRAAWQLFKARNLQGLLDLYKNTHASGARTIIMFLVIVLIFTGVFGTIALNLNNLSGNNDVAAIPGGTALISVVGILGIIVLVMWAVKRAF